MTESRRPVQRVEFILSQCEGKRVLHLGCTNWPYTEHAISSGTLLHSALAARSKQLYGIDSDEAGLRVLRNYGYDNLFVGNLEALEECEVGEQFDIVLAGEIIEHLNNPGLFLSGVKKFLRDDSKLLITTINAYCAMRFLIYAFRSKGGDLEPVHPDHVAYYSVSTLSLLLRRYGYRHAPILFYDVGMEHRPFGSRIVYLANDISVKLFPQLSDGLIAVCEV